MIATKVRGVAWVEAYQRGQRYTTPYSGEGLLTPQVLVWDLIYMSMYVNNMSNTYS